MSNYFPEFINAVNSSGPKKHTDKLVLSCIGMRSVGTAQDLID